MGRLAVHAELQGRGLGSVLLAEALRRAHENAAVVGSCMVVVDAIDERAAEFYRVHGFIRLPESMRLVLPMRTIGGLVAEKQLLVCCGAGARMRAGVWAGACGSGRCRIGVVELVEQALWRKRCATRRVGVVDPGGCRSMAKRAFVRIYGI